MAYGDGVAYNYIVVKSINDFPTPSGGVITLANNTCYVISGAIDVGTNIFSVGVSNTIRSNDRFNNSLISQSTGVMFTMDSSSVAKNSLIFDTISIGCPNGTLFSVSGGSSNQLTIITTTITSTGNLGTLSACALSIRTSSISNCVTTSGFVFSGSNTSFVLRDSSVVNNVGTVFNLTNATFSGIVGISRNFVNVSVGQAFLNATTVTTTYGHLTLNTFIGAGTFITGINEGTSLWLFDANQGITNTPVPASAAWGAITGTLGDQSDLQTALNSKQATLVSATNIKTINGASVLGSGDLVVSGGLTQQQIQTVAFLKT